MQCARRQAFASACACVNFGYHTTSLLAKYDARLILCAIIHAASIVIDIVLGKDDIHAAGILIDIVLVASFFISSTPLLSSSTSNSSRLT